MSKKLVIGAYTKWDNAQQAVEELLQKNIASDKISLIAGEKAKTYATEGSQPNKERNNVASGLSTGSVIGGLAGLILGATALMIPGVGPLVAAGPLYGAFMGVIAGGVGGGIIGVFGKWGMAEEDAHRYFDVVKNDGLIVAVETDDTQSNQISDILNRHNTFQPAIILTWHDLENLTSLPITKVDVDDKGNVSMPSHDTSTSTTEPQPLSAKTPGVPTIEAMTAAFSKHYRQTFATTGKPFAFYQRAYLEGYNLANDDRYRNKDWATIEPITKAYWEQFEPGVWDTVREAAHFGYEKTLQRV